MFTRWGVRWSLDSSRMDRLGLRGSSPELSQQHSSTGQVSPREEEEGTSQSPSPGSVRLGQLQVVLSCCKNEFSLCSCRFPGTPLAPVQGFLPGLLFFQV